MKLYELTKGDKFKVVGYEDVFTFHKLDGMYSICFQAGAIVHLSASAPVQLVTDPINGGATENANS